MTAECPGNGNFFRCGVPEKTTLYRRMPEERIQHAVQLAHNVRPDRLVAAFHTIFTDGSIQQT
jgi:hypothetical protein